MALLYKIQSQNNGKPECSIKTKSAVAVETVRCSVIFLDTV